MKKKRLRFKTHRLLAKREAKRTKAIIQELIGLISHILTTRGSELSYQQLEALLSQVQDRYIDKIMQELPQLIQQNLSIILRDTNLVFASQGFAIVQPTQQTQDLISAHISNHLELIKKIPQDIIQASKQNLLTSLVKFDAHTIKKTLSHISDVSERRAELIARDQTAKANSSLRISEALSLGYEYYTWSTSKDERVSTGEGGHKPLEGRIYSLTNPTAIIDTQGTKGHPSQRPNCRCTPQPLLYDERKQKLVLVKNKKEGDYYELKSI